LQFYGVCVLVYSTEETSNGLPRYSEYCFKLSFWIACVSFSSVHNFLLLTSRIQSPSTEIMFYSKSTLSSLRARAYRAPLRPAYSDKNVPLLHMATPGFRYVSSVEVNFCSGQTMPSKAYESQAVYLMRDAKEPMKVAEQTSSGSLERLSSEFNQITPVMSAVAESASREVHLFQADVMKFLYHTSYDLFQAFAFGKDPRFPIDQETKDKVDACLAELSVKSDKDKMEEARTTLQDIMVANIQDVIDRKARHHLTDAEKNSFLSKASDSWLDTSSDTCLCELVEDCTVALLESLDLVATATGWALVHLALNPEKQEYLFYELWPRTLQANGHITNETIKSSPYLSAVVNESDRWTPTSSAFEVMNYGTGVGGGVYEFNTEQWLESRMPRLDVSEIVDQSFKQTGACNTLGSALAEQQMKTILAHLVLDWKMYGPPSLGSFDDVKAKTVSSQLRPVMPTLQFVARSR
jgi:hypothetical protein